VTDGKSGGSTESNLVNLKNTNQECYTWQNDKLQYSYQR